LLRSFPADVGSSVSGTARLAYKYSFKVDTKSGSYAWKQMQTWRAKSQQHREQFENNISAASSNIYNAMINQTQVLGQITTQRALDRIQAAAAARAAAIDVSA
jgi:hypothetical protein